MDIPPRRVDADRRTCAASQAGLSLVEMLAALLVLGVLLSAFASSMVAFVREVNVNERRLLATQILSQAQEDFQVIPFEVAGTFESDVALLQDVGVVTASVPVFGDPPAPVVTLIDPDNVGCPDGDDECGVPGGVRPAVEVVEVGGFAYDLYRVFTWVDRSGDGIPDVKRLTSVVRWSVLGRDFEERSDAERVATRSEAGDPTALRAFPTIGPSPTWLEPDTGENLRTLRAYVRFTQPIVQAQLEFYSIDVVRDEDGEVVDIQPQLQQVPMIAGATDPQLGPGYIDFSVELPPGAYAFTDGPRIFRIVGNPTAPNPIVATRLIRFEGSGLDFIDDPFTDSSLAPGEGGGPPTVPGGDLVDVAITDVDVSRTQVRVNASNNNNPTLCELVVSAEVEGIYPDDGTVTLNYTIDDGQSTPAGPMTAVPPPVEIDPNGHTFEFRFATGSETFSNNHNVRFFVQARRSSDEDADGPSLSDIVQFSTANSIKDCPHDDGRGTS